MITIDCSALVPYLTAYTPPGPAIRRRLRDATDVYAPSLLDYEIASALLGLRRGKKITDRQVSKAVHDYRSLPLIKHPTLDLFDRVRELHANLSVYDAHYVALAEALDTPLVTCDARIARSGVARCRVEVFDGTV